MAPQQTKTDYTVHYQAEFERLYGDGNGALGAARKTEFDRFGKTGFPGKNTEEWRTTDITAVKDDYSVIIPQAFRKSFDDINFKYLPDIPRLVFVNGYYTAELSDYSKLPEGVKVNSLSYLLTQNPEAVAKRLEFNAGSESTPFSALNGALFNSGVWIEVDENLPLEVSLQLIFLTSGNGEKHSYQLRNFIDIGANSRLNLIEQYSGLGDSKYFNNIVNDVQVGEYAALRCTKIQNENTGGSQISLSNIYQEAGSLVDSMVVTLGGALVRNDSTVRLNGSGAECRLNGLYLGKMDQFIDNHTVIDHAVPECTSSEMFKGILDEKARAVFNGKVIVRVDAQKTDARQINRNLLLSDDAHINTNPQLEILADDVKCSHGSTTGQLNPDALFYLQSRGISARQAQSLMIKGFANEVLEQISDENIYRLASGMVADWFSFDDELKGVME